MLVNHLSAAYLGERAVLSPRLPRDRMLLENRTVRRVCVAPGVPGCLLALRGVYYNRGLWYRYVAEVPQDALHEPAGVPDAHETGELWLLERVEFRYAGIV